MVICTITQPENQLGIKISELLISETAYKRIVFVSAFVALRTVLRLRERLLEHVDAGARMCLTIGIDLGGTSREVLEELLRWNCETFVFHNTIARTTFHPKIYLFESEESATLFIGSNNLTDGGFYTNYEAATRYDFVLPVDALEYESLFRPLTPFLEPNGATVQLLNAALIQALVARGELPTEAEARQNRHNQPQKLVGNKALIPDNPFAPEAVPLPPLLPKNLRAEEKARPQLPKARRKKVPQVIGPRNLGVLVWKKTLTKSDAQQVREGSHPKGVVVLTQAGFKNPPGQLIDQTTYFRRLFNELVWEPEEGKHEDQEHTFVPMHIFIKGKDYGIHNFEVTHKPSGEAGQRNAPTCLRWGHGFTRIVIRENLTRTIFSLYETAGDNAAFLIDIEGA